MSLEGSFDDFSIQNVLMIICLGRKTGWLSVDSPSGRGAIVFQNGRVLASIDDEEGRATAYAPQADELIRERIACWLDRVARSRRGRFNFRISEKPPLVIGGRDIGAQTLRSGVDVIELLIDITCRQERDEHAANQDADRPARPSAPGHRLRAEPDSLGRNERGDAARQSAARHE